MKLKDGTKIQSRRAKRGFAVKKKSLEGELRCLEWNLTQEIILDRSQQAKDHFRTRILAVEKELDSICMEVK